MKFNPFWEFLFEKVSLLTEAQTPAEQAHDLGLHHVGYGYWANDNDEVMARTVQGHLVKFTSDAGKTALAAEKGDDDYGMELVKKGKDALKKLAIHALENMGMEEPYPAGLLTGLQLEIRNTLNTGKVPTSSIVDKTLDHDQSIAYNTFLDALAQNTNSKLAKAVKVYSNFLAWQDKKQKEKELAPTKYEINAAKKNLQSLYDALPPKVHDELNYFIEQQLKKTKFDLATTPSLMDCKNFVVELANHNFIPSDKQINIIKFIRSAIHAVLAEEDFDHGFFDIDFPPTVQISQHPADIAAEFVKQQLAPLHKYIGKIDITQAMDAAHITSLNTKEEEVFKALLKKADDAETTAQLNYIRALMKKAGLLGQNETQAFKNWKGLLKYIKSTKKDLIQGAKDKGKIKNKSIPFTSVNGTVNIDKLTSTDDNGNIVNPEDEHNYDPIDEPDTSNVKYLQKIDNPKDASADFTTHSQAFDQLFNKFNDTTPTVGSKSSAAIDAIGNKLNNPETKQEYQTLEHENTHDITNKFLDMMPPHLPFEKILKINKFVDDVLTGKSQLPNITKALDGVINHGAQMVLANIIQNKQKSPVDTEDSYDTSTALTVQQDIIDKSPSAALLQNFISGTGFDVTDFTPNEIQALSNTIKHVTHGQLNPNYIYDLDFLSDYNQVTLKNMVQKELNASAPPTQVPEPVTTTAPDINSYDVNKSAVNAINKVMQKPWNKGNPKNALKWITTKLLPATTTDVEREHLKQMTMALVKNHGLSLSDVPDELIPDVLKATAQPQSIDPAWELANNIMDDLEANGTTLNIAQAHAVKDAVEQCMELTMSPTLQLTVVQDLLNKGLDSNSATKAAQLITSHSNKKTTPAPITPANVTGDLTQIIMNDLEALAFNPLNSIQKTALNNIVKLSVQDGIIPSNALDYLTHGGLKPGAAKAAVIALKKHLNNTQSTNEPTSVEPAASTTPKIDPYKQADQLMNSDIGFLIKTKLTALEQDTVHDAIIKAFNSDDLQSLSKLSHTTSLNGTEVIALIKAVQNIKGGINNIPTTSTPAPEDNIAVKDVDPTNFVNQFMNSIGVKPGSIAPDAMVELAAATKEAFDSHTEFGVYFPFIDLKKSGKVPETYLNAIKFDIISKLESEGQLDTTEGAFKKYLDPTKAVNSFLTNVPQFANTLTPDQKQHIIDVAKQALQLPTYQQAKALYQAELVNKIPGFDESVFQPFRQSMAKYHDELKNAEVFEKQEKAKLVTAKKEAEELNKAMAMLNSGNLVTKLDGIVSVTYPSGTKTEKDKLKLAIAKALQLPTSQDVIDVLHQIKHGQKVLGGTVGGVDQIALNAPQYNKLQGLVMGLYFNQKNKPPTVPANVTEPSVSQTPETRAKSVFDNWALTHGTSTGVVPTQNSERSYLVKAVTDAIAEPNPNNVDAVLQAALTLHTSLTDDQIEELTQLVHQERQQPAVITGKTLPPPQEYSTSSGGAKSIEHEMEFQKKLKYYGVPLSSAKAVHDVILSGLASKYITPANKVTTAQSLKKQLIAVGMDTDSAHNMANWTTLQNIKKSDIAKKAASVLNPATLSTPSSDAQKVLTSILPTQDPHKIARYELVKGEQVKYDSHYWTKTKNGDSTNCHVRATEQDTWRKTNIKPADLATFNKAANSWQGSAQWTKDASTRKAVNAIMTKTIEGPPPQLTKVDNYVERGTSIPSSEFKDFIKAFRLNEQVYLGPSGFSANHSVPSGYASSDQSHVGVLFRVYPSKKTGMIKAARLHDRTGAGNFHHSGEQELVVGTNKNTRVTNVIKHIMPNSYGVVVRYEIEMQYEDDDVNESVNGTAASDGLNAALWKGLSPATVKMMIKYMNTPLRVISNNKE